MLSKVGITLPTRCPFSLFGNFSHFFPLGPLRSSILQVSSHLDIYHHKVKSMTLGILKEQNPGSQFPVVGDQRNRDYLFPDAGCAPVPRLAFLDHVRLGGCRALGVE